MDYSPARQQKHWGRWRTVIRMAVIAFWRAETTTDNAAYLKLGEKCLWPDRAIVLLDAFEPVPLKAAPGECSWGVQILLGQ